MRGVYPRHELPRLGIPLCLLAGPRLFQGPENQGGKAGTFDPGPHVPFVAWGLPTVCDVAGVPLEPGHVMDGRSLRPQLFGQSRDPRRWIYGCHYDSRNPSTRRSAWIRNKHFKLYPVVSPIQRH